jgi:hypothetical protein
MRITSDLCGNSIRELTPLTVVKHDTAVYCQLQDVVLAATSRVRKRKQWKPSDKKPKKSFNKKNP